MRTFFLYNQPLEAQLETLRNKFKSSEDVGEVVVVETPHVVVVWEGLEEMKTNSLSLGQVLSSSCIPSLSTVGRKFRQHLTTFTFHLTTYTSHPFT